MKALAIYDPHRKPKHWAETLAAGEFAAFFRDVATSQTLNASGVAFTAGAAEFCYVFKDINEARRYCEDLVREQDHVVCEIYDQRGMAVEPIYTIANARHEHTVGSKRNARLLMISGGLALVVSAPLFWYDWLSDGARLWPSLLGINLVILGLRLLHWGYNELERLKGREREQALVASGGASGEANQ